MNSITKKKNKIFITIGCTLLCLLTPLKAPPVYGASPDGIQADNSTGKTPRIEFLLSNGYRRDHLDWNIAGNKDGSNPNILSELTWDDLEIYQIKLQNKIILPGIAYVRAALNYGWIFDGENQDSDYLGDNRTFEFSRSNNSADDGHVVDATAALGYPFRFRFSQNQIFSMTPLIGYSYHEQNLKIKDGYQTISTPGLTPDIGPLQGLNSSYDTEWKGPWIGVDLQVGSNEIASLVERIEMVFSFEYHWADYQAEANWNLRADLAHPTSFKHDADGNGVVIAIGFNIVLSSHWVLSLNYDYQTWDTDDGKDRVFRADGTRSDTRLNEVNWESHTLSLGIGLRF